MIGWLDMASAPKDGSKFLLRVEEYLIKVVAYDADEKKFKVADGLWHTGEGCDWKPLEESDDY